MSAPRPFLVGHRTHSPATAARFVEAGVTYVELDVRVVAGQVVVTHYRPVLWSGGLLERDNARVRRRGSPPPDATVEQVLAGLPAGVAVVFDPKDREPDLRVRLAELLPGLVARPGQHVVSTRSRSDLDLFTDAGFRTWWTLDTPDQFRRAAADTLPAGGVTARQRSLTADLVGLLHTVTDTVVAWTVRDASRARELAAFGVDGITTHDLDVMAAVRAGDGGR